MKSFAKFLLIGTVAVLAIAMSAAPSEAAKKRHAARAASDSCADVGLCAATCNGKTCAVMICDWVQKKWVPSWTPMCLEGQCPPKC